MSQVIQQKKSRKKQSAFEKLWAKAAKLRTQNTKFQADLDALVTRVEGVVTPRERDLAKTQIPLLQKLLTLGQRKSMTNWERETLDDWIKELVETTHSYGLVNAELLDHVALYDAFRMGITLEDDSIPPHQQFIEMMSRADEEHAAQLEQEEERFQEQAQETRAALIREAQHKVERQLDSILGPEPAQPEKHAATNDLWADELESEEHRLQTEYRTKRAKMQEELMAQHMSEIDDMLNGHDGPDEVGFDFDDFDFDAFVHSIDDESTAEQAYDSGTNTTSTKAAMSNETFQRMFRATAGKLHPDRETDAEVRKEKQKLMAALLNARKKGDVLTVLDMFETYVGEHEGFSKTDQKELLESLKQMVEDLEEQKEEIIYQTPVHATTYHLFYSHSKKKVDQAVAERLDEISQQEKFIAYLIETITSLKTLKPELEERYHACMLPEPSLEDFMKFVTSNSL